MGKNHITMFLVGGAIRFFLATSKYSTTFGNRVEVSTPLNSFKRVQEGIFLYRHGIDPYEGDMVHELPIVLLILYEVLTRLPQLIPLLYTMLDLLTALVLYKMSQQFVRLKVLQQKPELVSFAPGTEELQMHKSDCEDIPKFVLMAYLFNPLSIVSCVGLTSTVFSNLLLSLFFYTLSRRWLLPCLFCLAVETLRNLYPMVLLAPILLVFGRKSVRTCIALVALFSSICVGICFLNYLTMNSWSFIDGTLGFIFFYRDLQPNIGLFWYFFTEMFDHFRTMFLITFQMNATVLYLIPLSLKLRKDPIMLATILVALMSIFRSYPCLGDVSFYLALLPLWRRCWKFMAHNFVVFCFFLITLAIMPALWHLWIYAGSANANFYFGATLAFSTGQIFLVTDLLFAYVKREFCLHHGQKIFVDGKEAKITLQ